MGDGKVVIPTVRRTRMRLADLEDASYNPREIDDDGLRGLQASMVRWGVVQPIVWNRRSSRIVGGHQRKKALLAAGVTEVDVAIVDLDDAEERALNLALNNPAIQGVFTQDVHKLAAEACAALGDITKEIKLDALKDIKVPEIKVRSAMVRQTLSCEPLVLPTPDQHTSLGHIQQAAGVVFGCRDTRNLEERDIESFLAWKTDPEAWPEVTRFMVSDLQVLIQHVLGVNAKGYFAVSAPPAGCDRSSAYPASELARGVAQATGMELVSAFEPRATIRRYHGKKDKNGRPLRGETPRAATLYKPLALVDDVCTTGETLKTCRAALAVPSLAFVWAFWHGKPG